MNTRTRLYPGDIVEMSGKDRGTALLAKVVEPGDAVTTVELLDGADPLDTDDPGPYRGDQLVVETSDLELAGPAQGRGIIQ